MSDRLVPISPAARALADRSPDDSERRGDEPYRRALTGMYARLAATLKDLTGADAARHAVAPQQPYLNSEQLVADLRVIEASLLSQHGSAVAAQTTAPLDPGCRSVSAFIWRRSICARVLTSIRPWLPSYSKPRASSCSTTPWRKPGGAACLLLQLNDARPLRVPGVEYSELTKSELAVFPDGAPDAHAALVPLQFATTSSAIPNPSATCSKCCLLQKEVGLLRGTLGAEPSADLIVVPLFETIPDLRNAVPIMREFYSLPGNAATGQAWWRRTRCDAGLLRQQQGRWQSSPATGSCTAQVRRWSNCSTDWPSADCRRSPAIRMVQRRCHRPRYAFACFMAVAALSDAEVGLVTRPSWRSHLAPSEARFD